MKKNSNIYFYAALYKFVKIHNLKEIKLSLFEQCLKNRIFGTILLAKEGINGTICSNLEGINIIIDYIKTFEIFKDIEVKYSQTDSIGFKRLKIKIKKEIVTIGDESINPNELAGDYVLAKDWNDLITKKDIMIIDTRNNYETSIGTFPNAIIPNTKSFRNFPEWVNNFAKTHKKNLEVAMFCTGGIRCEKASSYMKKIGFQKVYHLKGGILKYFEETKIKDNLWNGECFVFDERVSVNKKLQKGSYKQCFACKMPISDIDIVSDKYVEGISCPNCVEKTSCKQKEKFSQRQKQVILSKRKGLEHIGQNTPSYKKLKKITNEN